MPLHLGAFQIKETFMDMSSSDEDLVGPEDEDGQRQALLPNKEGMSQQRSQFQTQGNPQFENANNYQANAPQQPDLNSKENTEVLLCNMLFPADYDFEKDFVIPWQKQKAVSSRNAQGQETSEPKKSSVFNDTVKIIKRFHIENCQFDSMLQFSGFLSTIKDQIMLSNCMKGGVLEKIVIKNVKLP